MLYRCLSLLCLAFLPIFSVHADYSTEQVRLAATGRYDLLEQAITEYAATHQLATRDLHALCYAYSKTKRYTQLFSCLDRLDSSIRTGDRRTRLFGLADATPALHIMRAEALIELTRYPQAIVEAGKAIKWLREDRSDDLDMVCNALAALSLAYTLSGDEDGGWKYEKELRNVPIGMLSDFASAKAFALARARMALRDYRGVITAINENSSFQINAFLDKLVSGSFLTGTNNWLWAELPRAYMLNKALLETGRHEEAKAGFEHLLRIDQVRENGEIYWLLLHDRARIAEAESQADAALLLYRNAVDVIESQRASINTEANKIGFVGNKQQIYSRIVAIAQQQGQFETALEYIERAKSRALIDLLAAREENERNLVTDRETQLALEHYRLAQNAASAQDPRDMLKHQAGQSRLLIASKARELQSRDPNLASLVTVDALPAGELRRHIRPDEALLEFFGFGNVIYGLAMNDKQQQLRPIDAKGLDDTIREFRQAIQEQHPRANTLAHRLYDQLIRPFTPIIGQRNLLVVPHGALHYLPFATLQDGEQIMISGRSLRFLPSTSVQKYIRPNRRGRLDNILIYGNPDLDDPSLDLPNAEDEAKAIASLLPKSHILTRRAASETSFKKQAGEFNYLHVASHGLFKADNALESSLILAKDGENDGTLTVRELYQTRLNADLVTLSACETGLGKTLSGDDVLGLTRGFLYAGASNIVASLWEVADDATALLMKEFYQNLKNGSNKQEALRKAQLNLRKTHPSPFFWAAFYLTGDGI